MIESGVPERKSPSTCDGGGALTCCFMCLNMSAHGGIRTPNLLIRSQMLYPLSYARQL